MAKPDPVVIIGAGPVGLCLALALAQQEIAVVLVESLSDDGFLDQVPRAGSLSLRAAMRAHQDH